MIKIFIQLVILYMVLTSSLGLAQQCAEEPVQVARLTPMIVGGGVPAAAPSYTYLYSGDTTVTSSSAPGATYGVGSRVYVTSSITAKKLGFYLATVAGSTECKVSLYDYNAGNTQPVASSTGTVSSPVVGWNDNDGELSLALTGDAVDYYIVQATCNNSSWAIGTDLTSYGYYTNIGNYAGFPADPWSGDVSGTKYMTRIGY
jgi:hypothetical protein